MKRYIVFILSFLFASSLIAQDIAIEFSIEWKKELNFPFAEIKDKNIRPAYLNISYRNISNKPLYFLKISHGKYDLPEIIQLLRRYKYYPEQIPSHDSCYSKNSYIVGLQNCEFYSMPYSWYIQIDTTKFYCKRLTPSPVCDIVFEDEFGQINDNDTILGSNYIGDNGISHFLDNIYNFIYRKYYPEPPNQIGRNSELQFWYDSSDITQDTIMNNSIEKFVFLNPNETYTDTYNLIGFQIIGGTFTFQLNSTKSLDYVITESLWNNEYANKALPKKVGEYELFVGDFYTNSISVQFQGIK